MNNISLAINQFLDELKRAMQGQSAGLIQDAVYDVHSHFIDAIQEDSTADFDAIAGELGTPQDIAEQYIKLEYDAQRFIDGPNRPSSSFNGFFEPLSNIQDFKSLSYFFISMPLSIVYFGWLVLLGGTSLALSFLVVGLPLLATFLKVQAFLALFEGQLIHSSLGTRMPRRPVRLDVDLNNIKTFSHFIKANITGLYGWKISLYTALHLPLSTIYFCLSSLFFLASLALLVTPVIDPIVHWFFPSLEVDIQWYWFPITTLAGVIGMTLSLHISRALVKLHSGIANHLLVAK